MGNRERVARVPEWIVRAELSATARHVYDALALHANKERMARPGIDTLAAIVGKSPRTVQRTLHGLEDAGVIETARLGGGRCRATTYHLPEEGDAQSVTVWCRKTVTDSAKTVTGPSAKGDRIQANGDTQDVTRTREQDEQENIQADSPGRPAHAATGSPLENGRRGNASADGRHRHATAERMTEIKREVGLLCECGGWKSPTDESCPGCAYSKRHTAEVEGTTDG